MMWTARSRQLDLPTLTPHNHTNISINTLKPDLDKPRVSEIINFFKAQKTPTYASPSKTASIVQHDGLAKLQVPV